MEDKQPQGSVDPTPPRALAVGAMLGALGGWLIPVTAEAFDLVPPSVPWTAPVALGLVAALVGALAYSTHQRIQVRRERMDPQRAVAFLVLGKSSALAGAVVVGGYLVYALRFIAQLDISGPRERVLGSGLSVVAGVGLLIAGLLLERACRVPRGPDDDESDSTDQDTRR